MNQQDRPPAPPWIRDAWRHVEQRHEVWHATPTTPHALAFTEAFVETLALYTTAMLPAGLEDMPEVFCGCWGVVVRPQGDDDPCRLLYHDLRAALARHGFYEWRLFLKDRVEHDTWPALWWCLQRLPYPQYLQTQHWKALRETMLQHSGYRCQVCNSKGPLRVHHRTYERRGCEQLTDLVVLCKDCHEIFHTQGKLAKPSDEEDSTV